MDIQNRTGSALPVYYVDSITLRQASSLPPGLASVRAGGDQNVVAFFDTSVTTGSAGNATNYQLQSATHAYYNTRRTATAAQYDATRLRVALTFTSNFVAGARYTLYINNVTNTAGMAILPDTSLAFAFSNQTVTVNALAGNHAISSLIYGVAWAPSTNALRDSGATVHRWGGNHTSTYNWLANAKNSGNDWYFENYPWSDGSSFGAPSNAVQFADWNTAAGVASVLTVPALPYVARNTVSNSFSVAKYGPQQAVDPYDSDAGNGVGINGTNIVNNPLDSGIPARAQPRAGDPVGTVYMNQWLSNVLATATAGSAALPFLAMDNEMDIWNSTHRDWHPAATTYDELWSVFTNYAAMVRSVAPQSQICGPVSCCWWYYWNSAAGDADKAAHGGVDFLPWFLDRAQQYEIQTGQRLLDVLDIHYYPESFGSDTSVSNAALRLRSTRELWDATYRSEGWIGSDQWATQTQTNRNYPQLIPRFKALVAEHYPGIKLALTEYNWGADNSLNGTLAIADCLGILGRENVDIAIYWTFPPLPGTLAFKLYRNYDGNHATFGDRACQATAGDPNFFTAYAATESAGGAVTLVVVNKDPNFDYRAALAFANFIPAPTASVYQVSAADLQTVRREPDITNAATNFTFVFPAYSATLLRFTAADSDNDGIPDLWMMQNFSHATGQAFDKSRAQDDADGDGFTNLQEYLAGTGPRNAASALRIESAGPVGNDVVLRFTTVDGKTYIVERKDNLSDPQWTEVGTILGDGTVKQISDPGAAVLPKRFYRLRLVP